MAVGAIELYVRNEDGELVAATLAGVDATLAGLSDVNITDPQDGDVLSYDTDEWVNTAGSGGGADSWVEGPNLIVNGDFEDAEEPLGFDGYWSIYFNNETSEYVTASPIAGTQSLHVVTTGEANEYEGVVAFNDNDAPHRVAPNDVLRTRFKIKGTTGTVRVVLKFERVVSTVGPSSYSWLLWEGDPGATVESVSLDMIVPDAAALSSPPLDLTDRYRFRLYFWSYNEIADFTIDDVYHGVLTPA